MADAQLDEYDYYTLLGVEPTASDDELRRAFKKFALKYHPDRFAGGPEEKIERATAIYRRGSEAIEVLSDPKQRKAYDAGLARGELRLTSDPGARRENVRASRPKTEPGTRRSVRGAKAPRPAETIQSPSARAFYAKAVELARAGDTRAAWRAVQSAIAQEPGNPILEEALKRIERQMR
ncbi:MAG: DnaJ domain-containing protein [Sandaracinus sp.]